jgi:hypothetical protein
MHQRKGKTKVNKMRLIPPKIKQKMTLFYGLTITDFLVLFIALFIAFLLVNTNLPELIRVALAVIVFVIGVGLVTKPLGRPIYLVVLDIFTYWYRNRKIDEFDFKKKTGFAIGSDYVKSKEEYSIIIECIGIDFFLLEKDLQNLTINRISQAFQKIKKGKIVKIDKPIDYTSYINIFKDEIKEYKSIDPKLYATQIQALMENIEILQTANESKSYTAESYYIIIYNKNLKELKEQCELIIHDISNTSIACKILKGDEIKEVYELFYKTKLDNTDNFIMPQITEKINHIKIEDQKYKICTVLKFPFFVSNGWLVRIFKIENCRIVMNMVQDEEVSKVKKHIDRSITELNSRYIDKNATESQKLEIEKQIDGLRDLLDAFTLNQECLHNVMIYIIYDEKNKRAIEESFKDSGMLIDRLDFKQLDSYISAGLYRFDHVKNYNNYKDIQSSSLAASFPFDSQLFMDQKGHYIGANAHPVMFDLFYSWGNKDTSKRTNCNAFIIGKSGAGKSFFMKSEIVKLLADNVKIIILDPDNEFAKLCNEFHGSWIDMGGVGNGRINPLQVISSLSDDEMGRDMSAVTNHRGFLQSFFKSVIKLDDECFPFLNIVIEALYRDFKILDSTDLAKLSNNDFPIIDDLCKVIEKYITQTATSASTQYENRMYVRLKYALKDFSDGGIYSKLWNGRTTLSVDGQFTVLNFQSLFSSNNTTMANGQMILAMRYLNQAIIKNRTNNMLKDRADRILIAVDEAHRFINKHFTIALESMKNMAKQIRKYGGSLVVTTQNVADFVGDDATRSEATAVINACQYGVFFGLNANDLSAVLDLYKNVNGGLNKIETSFLANAERGQALIIVSATERIRVRIDAIDAHLKYFD